MYYSTEYDDYYDDEDGFYDFAAAIQSDRTDFFQVIMICVELTVCLISVIQIEQLKIHK